MRTIVRTVAFLDLEGNHVATVVLTIEDVPDGETFCETTFVIAAEEVLRENAAQDGLTLPQALIGAIVRE